MNAIEEIPSRMAENAAFYWLLHDKALNSSDYDLADLIELEERIDAQLDGLQAYGDEGWMACEDALQFEEPGEIFTAAVFAFASGDNKRIQKAVETGCASNENHQALLSALSWLPFDTVKNWLGKLMQASNPAYQCLGISACALHRANCGDTLNKVMASPLLKESPEYFSQVIRSIAIMDRKNMLGVINNFEEDTDEKIAFASIYTSMMLGDISNMSQLKPFVFGDMSVTESAIDIVFRALSIDEAKAWIQELGKDSAKLRSMIQAIGVLGDSSALPWLLKQMESTDNAQLAANSFSMITGIDLDVENMTKGVSDTESLPNENLPLPDATKVAGWYRDNTSRFVAGQRYLAGDVISYEHCKKVIQQGKQNQRKAAWLELNLNLNNKQEFECAKRLRI